MQELCCWIFKECIIHSYFSLFISVNLCEIFMDILRNFRGSVYGFARILLGASVDFRGMSVKTSQ